MEKQIISLHIKFYKSNYFFIVSNSLGQVVFLKTSGKLGFRNMQKRGVEALSMLLETCLQEILYLKKKYFFLNIEGFKLSFLRTLYKHLIAFFKKNKMTLIGVKHIHKNSHNGCRRKK